MPVHSNSVLMTNIKTNAFLHHEDTFDEAESQINCKVMGLNTFRPDFLGVYFTIA